MVENQTLRRSHSEKEMLTANMLAMERERAALAYSQAPLLGHGLLGHGLLGHRSVLYGLSGYDGYGGLGRLGGLGFPRR